MAGKALPTKRRCADPQCSRQFRVQRGGASRRYCFTCRPARSGNVDEGGANGGTLFAGPGAPDLEQHPLVMACRAELGARAPSLDGLMLLEVVKQIAQGGHSATRLTGLMRTYDAQRKVALAGPPPAPASPADEAPAGDVVAGIFGRAAAR